MKARSAAGFTLLEVMITVVIVGILAAIAYPSYQEYVLRSNRAEGMAMLNDAAARQERYYAQTNAYITATDDIGKLGLSSTNSQTGKYSLSVGSGGGGYTLTATPQGAQANDTKCGNLTLNAQGTKGKSGSSSTNDCWR